MPAKQLHEHMIDNAVGHYIPKRDEPKTGFSSMLFRWILRFIQMVTQVRPRFWPLVIFGVK